MSYLDEVKKGVNPHGIAYADMTKGKHVVVDIPIKHGEDVVEVEGTISSALWYDHPCHSVNSQINLTKQNTKQDVILFGRGLYAVYAERIKRIF